MIHSILIVFWTVFATIFFGLATIIASFLSSDGNLPHRIARLWARSIIDASLVKVTIKGAQNMVPSSSCIYMCNHQSLYDIPVILAFLKVQFRWLAKVELFKIPIFGLAMKRAGYISIDRSDRSSAFRSLSKAARIIRDGTSVLIFPEGTRTKNGKIRSYKKGGFVLAVDSGVPVIPVILHGTWSILPKNRNRIIPGEVVMEILPPIQASEYTRKTKDKLLEDVREKMCGVFYRGA